MATTLMHKIRARFLASKPEDPAVEAKNFFEGYYERHPVSQKTKDLEVLETHKILEQQRNAYLEKRKQGVIRY